MTASTALHTLTTQEPEREEIATEMILAAVRVATETLNYRVLAQLHDAGSASVAELMTHSGLGRLAVLERVNQLTQVGLTSRDLQSDTVQATRLTTGLVGFIEQVKKRFMEKIIERLPQLLESST
jgi:predicted transcriptional regulator